MTKTEMPAAIVDVVKKGKKKRGRRAGSRAAKRRARLARKTASAAAFTTPNDLVSPARCAVHAFFFRYASALLKVPTHLPPKIHAGPPTKRVKRVSWREDTSSSPAAGGGDPAVLAMGPARKPLQYTRDELMRLRNSPLVKRGLETAFLGNDALQLVLKKRSDSPNEEDKGGRGDAPNENHKRDREGYGRERDRDRRSADPRERVRKESEPSAPGGIVLSPQRRSFTSGCGAPTTLAPAPPPQIPRRAESPHHNEQGRRIGSGRIMVRDSDSRWDNEENYRAETYRPPPREREERLRDRANGDRYDRRSFNRDSYTSDMKRERDERFNNNEKTRDREDNRRSGGRYSQRRFEKEDEPEWFSGGPTSQLETIELRGFDDPPKKSSNNNKENDKKSSGGSRSRTPERWRSDSTSTPPPAQHNNDSVNTSNDKDSGVESKAEEPQGGDEQPEFNLDDFLKFDSLPDVLTNGGGETEGGSRFSRWFRRDSPTNDRHYDAMLHNIVDDLERSPNSSVLTGPGIHPSQNQVFAPISPAASGRPPSLLDLLRRANAEEGRDMNQANVSAGKVHSLEELEARLRPQPSAQPQHTTDHDLTAFKRLLAQVSGGHAVPAAADQQPRPPQPQPMSLLQMLNKSIEQQAKVQQQQQQQQPHIPQELLYKLLQVQQRQQHQQQAAGDVSAMDRELLQRPEAQAIIHGLKAGEITVQHLMQQLGNPGLQSRHREVLLTILRLHQQQRQQQMGGSPLPAGVGATNAHLAVPPHHVPLRLSPLPHPAVPARIPSPRELAAHTQSIMQGALIKKKLEEQRENFRRRQEMQGQPKQQPPISFTPTSVLRKMTAEKEVESSVKQQWVQPHKVPQGRPIVKGNQSGTAPSLGYSPSPAEYQQHYLNQQQQMVAGIRQFPHSQQRQAPTPVNNMNNLSNFTNITRGVPPGATLQQLLMQSQQRGFNEMAAGAGGGDNQLARWFSPELLARASAGKLPSVHVPNALSLEDLERHHHSPAPPVRN